VSTIEAPAVPAAAPDRVPRWRRILAVVLIVLSCVLTPITVMALWLHDDLLDTDGYVNTITPLAENEEILQAVSVRLTNALFENVDVETLAEENLPARITFLAGPLTDALEDFTQDAVLDFLQSERFRSLWEQINRLAHTQIDKALTGGGELVSTEEGKVVLDLTPLVDRVRSELDDRGVTIFDDVTIDPERLQFELIDARGLESAQSAVRLLNTLRWVLPVLVLVLGAAGVLLARSRRRMLMWWGLGVVVSTLLIGFGLSFGRDFYLDHLPEDTNRDAAAAAYDILVRLLRTSNRVLFAVALIVAIGAYLAGGSRVALAVRGRTMGALDRAGDRAAGTGLDVGGVGRFAARYVGALSVGGIIVSFLILIAMGQPDGSTVLWLLLVLLVYLAVVTILARIGRDRLAVSDRADHV
jgi:hypothetical protein